MVEGMLGSENTSLLFYTDYGSFEEVSINTAGNSAEMPGNGVYSLFIAKSGGNRYSGSVYIDYYNDSFSAVNIDADLIARGVTGSDTLRAEDTNRTKIIRDFNADLGGYIVKDKLWWYGSYRYSVNQVARPNFPVRPQDTQVSIVPEGDLQPQLQQQAVWLHQPQQQETARSDQCRSDLSGRRQHMESDRIPGRRLESRIQLDVVAFRILRDPRRQLLLQLDQRGEDRSAALRGSRHARRFGKRAGLLQRTQTTSGVCDRQLVQECGWQPQPAEWRRGYGRVARRVQEGGRPGNVVHGMRSGAPAEVTLWETPNSSLSGLRTYAAFIQDTWRINNRLTITPGLRFDRFRDYLQKQDHTNPFNGQVTPFPAVDNVYDTNNWGPRSGSPTTSPGKDAPS